MSVEENLLMGAFSRTDPDIKSDVDLVFSYFPALSSSEPPRPRSCQAVNNKC